MGDCLRSREHQFLELYSKLYSKCEISKLKLRFFKACKEDKILPKGLRLSFNLAWETSNSSLCNQILQILNSASAQIVDTLIVELEKMICTISQEMLLLRDVTKNLMGTLQMSRMITKVKTKTKSGITIVKSTLERKLENLRLAAFSPEFRRKFSNNGSKAIKAFQIA